MDSLELEVGRIGESNEVLMFELLSSIDLEKANKNVVFLMDLLTRSNRRWIINGCPLALSESSVRHE